MAELFAFTGLKVSCRRCPKCGYLASQGTVESKRHNYYCPTQCGTHFSKFVIEAWGDPDQNIKKRG